MRLALLLAATLLTPLALAAAEPAKPRYGSWGVATEHMDTAVAPGGDFYAYALGRWLQDHPIPADKRGAGYNYDLPDEIELQVRAIVEEVAKSPTSPVAAKVGDAYAAYMDTAGIEARGTAPLKPWLDRIAAVSSRRALVDLLMTPGYAKPVAIGIDADQDDPTRYTLGIGQGRLGLPSRDYYLLKGEKYDGFRAAYRAYVTKMLGLAGFSDAAARADRVIALETRLAEDQWTPERRRDPVATHNPMDRAGLDKLAPEFDWGPTLAGLGLPDARVDVAETTAVAATGKRLADVPLETWKDMLAFRFVSDHADVLPLAFDKARFDFYGRTLSDIPEQRARWKRGVAMLDNSLGEALGQVYVERYWPAATSKLAAELVADVQAAYADKIAAAAWMDAPTRAAAQKKLASFDPRIGHPANWTDYSALKVSRSDPRANAMASSGVEWQLRRSRYPGPVDRGLWEMTPQTVNAYYQPTLNQITVPAAILQPPFFDPAADPAVNYAETGATTIGHELGHGFDDQGRQYDDKGRLRDWWSPATAALYKAKADRLAAQFDAYEPLPGVHIKGRLTLGENLADLGGLETAYATYRRYVARHGEPPVIGGFTGDQRFFLAYAHAWQGKTRDGALRQQLLSDPHSPDKYRVNGIVRNFDPWYTAFGVKPGDAMYLPPAKRVRVWE